PPPPSLSALPPPPPTPPPFPYTTLFRSFALGHQVARDLQPIDGRPEGRVDLVGDAGREAAEGGHLLGRHELLLARLQRPVGRLELGERCGEPILRCGELMRALVHPPLEVAVEE